MAIRDENIAIRRHDNIVGLVESVGAIAGDSGLTQSHQDLSVGFLAGTISGQAPLFERFVLGNAETLRGWNKFELDPLGASHVAHGSIDYSYRSFLVFYDTGAVWDRPEEREQKQSLGLGCRKSGFQLAVAFPVKSGTVNPVFYAGMNF